MEILLCQNCINYLSELKCLAFPDGIPDIILNGESGHSKPLQNQDSNMVYEPIKK
jgi:hypothetical protein